MADVIMNMRAIYSLIFLFSAYVFTGCKKEYSYEHEPFDCMKATVRWTGDPALDGRGWQLQKDSTNIWYEPLNLPAQFKHDSLKVSVCLQKTDTRVYCFCSGTFYAYTIISIELR